MVRVFFGDCGLWTAVEVVVVDKSVDSAVPPEPRLLLLMYGC
jgi:hypothetical protein